MDDYCDCVVCNASRCDYPAWARLWKQMSKMQYEMVGILKRAEGDYEEQLRIVHALADSRKELLRRCKSVIDVCGIDWEYATSALDAALFDELEEELGDGD